MNKLYYSTPVHQTHPGTFLYKTRVKPLPPSEPTMTNLNQSTSSIGGGPKGLDAQKAARG